MWCSNQVLEAAEEFNIQVTQIDKDTANRLKIQLDKYLHQRADRTRCKIVYPHGWMFMKDYVQETESILFFGLQVEEAMFKIRNGAELNTILENTGCSFTYLTSETGNFLLEWNDYDYLIAYKDAIPWLEKYADDHNIPRESYIEP